MEVWHSWMIVLIVLLILEIFTPGFVAGVLGIAAIVPALVTLIKPETATTVQLLVYVIAAAVLFVFIRPLMLKFMPAYNKKGEQTNALSLIGKTGRVTQQIEPDGSQGRVKCGGDDWRAATTGKEPIPIGSEVIVISIEGCTLTVTLSSQEG